MIETGLRYYIAESQNPKKFTQHTTVTKPIRIAIAYVRTATVDGKAYYVYRIRTTPHYLFEEINRKPQQITPTLPLPAPKRTKGRKEASFGLLDFLGLCRKVYWPRWKME